MIIAINGYIGSGKDTVGQIIQYLTDWKKLGFPSDEHVDMWLRSKHERYDNPTWEIKKFGGKLKEIATLLTGIPTEKFEDQDFKKSYLPSEWSRIEHPYAFDNDKTVYETKMTVRELLQKLGTEAIRNNLHTNAWVNALFADYKPISGIRYDDGRPDTHLVYPNWIITDCRFPNEAEAVQEKGGIIIRVERELAEVPYQTLEQRHPSETSLDDWEFDYVIKNNGTIEELTALVRGILRKEKILQ